MAEQVSTFPFQKGETEIQRICCAKDRNSRANSKPWSSTSAFRAHRTGSRAPDLSHGPTPSALLLAPVLLVTVRTAVLAR